MKHLPLYLKASLAVPFFAIAQASQAAFAIINLDAPNKVVGQTSQSIWFSGSIDITQDYNFCTLFVYHPYLEGGYAARLDVNSYAQSFYDWLGTNGSHFAGAHYQGQIFELTQEASDPVGFYNHRGTSLTAPAVAYMYFNGNSQPEGRSNEAEFSVQVVPEPATMAVLGLGLLPILKRRRR